MAFFKRFPKSRAGWALWALVLIVFVSGFVLGDSTGQIFGQSEFEPLATCEGGQEYYDTVVIAIGDQIENELIVAYEHLQARDSRAFFSSMEIAEEMAEQFADSVPIECARFAHERFVLAETEFVEAFYALADSDLERFNEHLRWAWRYAGEGRGYLIAYGVTVQERPRHEEEE